MQTSSPYLLACSLASEFPILWLMSLLPLVSSRRIVANEIIMQPIKNDVSDKSILTYTNPDKAGWWADILAPSSQDCQPVHFALHAGL
jgi:hypothetical protein